MDRKTVIVTGASHGIGKATVTAFADKGYNSVILYDKSESNATALQDMLLQKGYSVFCLHCDVSNEDSVISMINSVMERFGSIDVLVNNAGVSFEGMLQDTSLAKWNEVFATNMTGVFLCTRAVIDQMIRQKYGRIINVSSIWGIVGASCEVCYSSSKGAVIAFTKALAKELGPSSITVNCIAPGVIDTRMNAKLSAEDLADLRNQTPLEKIGNPNDIANVITFLASSSADFITGQIISPNGGLVI